MHAADYAARLHILPTDIVYDIGANSGHVTEILASAAKHVYAFEPNLAVIAALAARSLPNVTIVNEAVSDVAGTADFHVDVRENVGAVASSLLKLPGLEGQTELLTVKTTTVDEFARRTGTTPDLIKIDVEGFEPEVLTGAAETIARRRHVIIFEGWEERWEIFLPVIVQLQRDYHCTAPGFLDTGLHYAARLMHVSSQTARASSGLR